MPWYAHFLRLRVKPFSEITYRARSEWANPYPLGGGVYYTAQRYSGRCTAHLE
jgi:hypothetical protein